MPSLAPNITNRVRKLPKPSNSAQAMQPLFEAVSNAIFAIEDIQKNEPNYRGFVSITIRDLANVDRIEINVLDNGIGLDRDRYDAFCQVDTAFKLDRGGKGVGRLFWLDGFSRTHVESRFPSAADRIEKRSFDFVLTNNEQVQEVDRFEWATTASGTGTRVTFKGLRGESYRKQFPKTEDTFLRYFSAHFIADFLMGSGPEVVVDIDGSLTRYPSAVSDLVVGKPFEGVTEEHAEFKKLTITGFTCKADASTGLDGMHQLHLLADGRNVEPRKIDKLLGITRVTRGIFEDLVFHGCVSGEYLDQHVNEGRTAFNLGETKLKELSRYCTDFVKKNFLTDQIKKYEEERRKDYREFVERYPIYGFADEDTQLNRVPFGARVPEEFATGLVKYQIRRDETRQDEIERVIGLLEQGEDIDNFASTVIEAAKGVQQSEQLALAQHVVRRKLVLELLERLIRRIRERADNQQDYHLESTLHSLIVPMRVQGNDPNSVEATAHDLWIVDERLAFTRSFSSDQRLKKTLAGNDTKLRPDLLVWNLAHGLGVVDPTDTQAEVDVSEPLRKVMIVEFKRPGRTNYTTIDDHLEGQITKYLRQLKDGDVETFRRQKVRIAKDCIFYCYVVADIVGDLKEQLAGWSTTANGEGRIRSLDNEFKGSTIEVIQWQDLVNDAWSRNEATLNAAGFRRSKKVRWA